MAIRGFLLGLAVVCCHHLLGSGRTCLSNVYKSQIGVTELSGQNDGRQVEAYLRSCNLPKGNPWCAAFVNWCFVKCGLSGANSALAAHWFPRNRVIYFRNKRPLILPKRGDLVGFSFGNNRIDHMAFVDEWNEKGAIKTVEGNTSNGVYGKRRMRSSIYIASKWTD